MSTNVRFYLSYDIKITLKSHFCCKNVIILSLCTQRCYGRHNVSRKSSGLSILLHGVISLPDAMSYDKLLRVEGCYQKSLTKDFLKLSAKYRSILLKCALKHETIISKKKLVKMIA